jgi:hypothetical protein
VSFVVDIRVLKFDLCQHITDFGSHEKDVINVLLEKSEMIMDLLSELDAASEGDLPR